MNEAYRAEIIRIVNDIDDTEVLKNIYSIAILSHEHLTNNRKEGKAYENNDCLSE